MIPQGGSLSSNPSIKTSLQPSKTYRLDTVNNRIVGMIDNLDAVKQAVWKILQTERNSLPIYGSNYGMDTSGIIGSDFTIARSLVAHRIREALLYDDRINDVTEFNITVNGDEILAKFTVVSRYGKFEAQKGI
jgi:hypothetical protein